jgi:menaquinone-dependent protoporphyrinogen oxidase
VYAGRLHKDVPAFCESHRDELTSLPVGLFVGCLYTGEKAMQQLEQGFPPWILSRAFGKYVVGGEVKMEELSFLHRLIMRGVAKTKEDISSLDEPEIERMIAEVRARVA